MKDFDEKKNLTGNGFSSEGGTITRRSRHRVPHSLGLRFDWMHGDYWKQERERKISYV